MDSTSITFTCKIDKIKLWDLEIWNVLLPTMSYYCYGITANLIFEVYWKFEKATIDRKKHFYEFKNLVYFYQIKSNEVKLI